MEYNAISVGLHVAEELVPRHRAGTLTVDVLDTTIPGEWRRVARVTKPSETNEWWLRSPNRGLSFPYMLPDGLLVPGHTYELFAHLEVHRAWWRRIFGQLSRTARQVPAHSYQSVLLPGDLVGVSRTKFSLSELTAAHHYIIELQEI